MAEVVVVAVPVSVLPELVAPVPVFPEPVAVDLQQHSLLPVRLRNCTPVLLLIANRNTYKMPFLILPLID